MTSVVHFFLIVFQGCYFLFDSEENAEKFIKDPGRMEMMYVLQTFLAVHNCGDNHSTWLYINYIYVSVICCAIFLYVYTGIIPANASKIFRQSSHKMLTGISWPPIRRWTRGKLQGSGMLRSVCKSQWLSNHPSILWHHFSSVCEVPRQKASKEQLAHVADGSTLTHDILSYGKDQRDGTIFEDAIYKQPLEMLEMGMAVLVL